MFRLIYYALGIGISAVYMGGMIISSFDFSTPKTPTVQKLGGLRIERGKYIPPPPPGTSGSRSGSTYPGGGGYSGGK